MLVTRRLKGSGMAWSQMGGQAILTLRSLAVSDRFYPAWKIVAPNWKI
ncbi:MAG: hypothetical protein OXC63_03595 [Aestuariivita sp.]|nr:hypothetical protein [Aestuariivita sp.]